jgi:hypothetical protein
VIRSRLGGWSMAAQAHRTHRGHRVPGWRHGVRYEGDMVAVYGDGGGKGSVAQWQAAMGINWTYSKHEPLLTRVWSKERAELSAPGVQGAASIRCASISSAQLASDGQVPHPGPTAILLPLRSRAVRPWSGSAGPTRSSPRPAEHDESVEREHRSTGDAAAGPSWLRLRHGPCGGPDGCAVRAGTDRAGGAAPVGRGRRLGEGPLPPNPSELLPSQQMQAVLSPARALRPLISASRRCLNPVYNRATFCSAPAAARPRVVTRP